MFMRFLDQMSTTVASAAEAAENATTEKGVAASIAVQEQRRVLLFQGFASLVHRTSVFLGGDERL